MEPKSCSFTKFLFLKNNIKIFVVPEGVAAEPEVDDESTVEEPDFGAVEPTVPLLAL